jgi:hypothetical protein
MQGSSQPSEAVLRSGGDGVDEADVLRPPERCVRKRPIAMDTVRAGEEPYRSDLKPARTSSEKSFGCSQAAKCPPLGSLLK